MDMADLMALMGLEFLYDVVEERFGRVAAFVVTLASALALLAIVAWLPVQILNP